MKESNFKKIDDMLGGMWITYIISGVLTILFVYELGMLFLFIAIFIGFLGLFHSLMGNRQ